MNEHHRATPIEFVNTSNRVTEIDDDWSERDAISMQNIQRMPISRNAASRSALYGRKQARRVGGETSPAPFVNCTRWKSGCSSIAKVHTG
jgi:hypothetical protein